MKSLRSTGSAVGRARRGEDTPAAPWNDGASVSTDRQAAPPAS